MSHKIEIECFQQWHWVLRRNVTRYRLKGTKRTGVMLVRCSNSKCPEPYHFERGYKGVDFRFWPCAFCGATGLRKASVRTLKHDNPNAKEGQVW